MRKLIRFNDDLVVYEGDTYGMERVEAPDIQVQFPNDVAPTRELAMEVLLKCGIVRNNAEFLVPEAMNLVEKLYAVLMECFTRTGMGNPYGVVLRKNP